MRVIAAVLVREYSMLQRQRFSTAEGFVSQSFPKGKLLDLSCSFHIPSGERPLNRVSKDENPFHLWIVTPNSRGCRFPVHVNRSGLAQDQMLGQGLKKGMVVVIRRLTAEERFGIEIVDFFKTVWNANLRMLAQKKMEGGGSSLLSSADDKPDFECRRVHS
jgi:hypothetical protein